jgi:hypothetical protein
MLNNLRNRLPDIEDAREVAVERVMKAANSAAQATKDASEHLEDWAWEGLASVRSRPLMWAAISLGFGVLIGGVFAVWQKARPNGHVALRAVPVRARSKPKRRAPKTRRMQPSLDA